MNYFQGLNTVEEIKAHYKNLARKNHPDLGGDLEVMKEINNQYERALKGCHGQESKDSEGRTHTYKYNAETEQAIINKISELIALNLETVEISLIGVYLWITGDTKPSKDKLKGAGCYWHSKRGCWYWKPAEVRSYGQSKGDLDELARKYGCTNIGKKGKAAIA
jgi:hypothetical protein